MDGLVLAWITAICGHLSVNTIQICRVALVCQTRLGGRHNFGLLMKRDARGFEEGLAGANWILMNYVLVDGSCGILTLGHWCLAHVAFIRRGYASVSVRAIVLFHLLAILRAIHPRVIIVTAVVQLRGWCVQTVVGILGLVVRHEASTHEVLLLHRWCVDYTTRTDDAANHGLSA